jgi:hypothetical protein
MCVFPLTQGSVLTLRVAQRLLADVPCWCAGPWRLMSGCRVPPHKQPPPISMTSMRDHRSYLAVCQAVQGAGPPAPSAAATVQPRQPMQQRQQQNQPCGPAPCPPACVVVVDGCIYPVSQSVCGCGPSTAPPCPDVDTHVWMFGAWRRMQACRQQRPPQVVSAEAPYAGPQGAPTPPITRTPTPTATAPVGSAAAVASVRRSMVAPRGPYALLWGPSYTAVVDAGGAGLRAQLSHASRVAAAGEGGEGVPSALAALSSGRMQWLGSNTQHGVPVRIMLSSSAMRVLAIHAVTAKAALRRLGGDWHLVLYNVPLTPSYVAVPPTQSAMEMFSSVPLPELVEGGCEVDDSAVDVPCPDVDLTGAVVLKGGRFGVATRLTSDPSTYSVVYLEGGDDTMSVATVVVRMVVTWSAVPVAYQRRLRALGGRMQKPVAGAKLVANMPPAGGAGADGAAPCAPVADDAHHGAIIRKRFTAGTYFGAVTFLPTGHPDRAGEFVYRATYTDMDTETLKASTVRRLVVKSWSRIPQPLHTVLRALGGEVPVTNPAAPAMVVSTPLAQTTPLAAPTTAARTTHQNAPQQQHSSQQRRARAQARRRRRQAANIYRAATLAWCRQGIKVGFINVCGMTQVKAGELAQAVHALGLDILGVAETWEGKCQPGHIAGYTYIGKPRVGGRGGGVGFFVNTVLAPLITPHMHTSVAESMWLEIRQTRSGAQPLFVGLVYLPPSTLSNADNIAATYAAVQTDIENFAQRGDTMVIGDFNSRVGRALTSDACVGQYGEAHLDAAGQALRDMLGRTSLVCLNDRTPSDDGIAPRTPAYTRLRQLATATGYVEQCAVLDYYLVPPAWVHAHGFCLHVDTFWKPQGADHALLWTIIPHHMPHTQDAMHTRNKPNVHLLTRPSDMQQHHREAYAEAVHIAFHGYDQMIYNLQAQVDNGDLSPANAVQHAKHDMCMRMHTAINHSIGYKDTRRQRNTPRHPPIFTREVRQAVADRRTAEKVLTHVRSHAHSANQFQAAHMAYHNSTKQVKITVAAARQRLRDNNIAMTIGHMQRHDTKAMWRSLKRLNGAASTGIGPSMLQTSDGSLTMAEQQIANILATQYERTTNVDTFADAAGFDATHKTNIEAEVIRYRQSTEQGPETLEASIDLVEVQVQCARLHNWKAPSPIDDINNELLKYGQQHMHAALTALFNLQFTLEHKAQTPGVIIPLYKKDDPTLAVNYRPITLGSTIDKLYNSVLNARIMGYLEQHSKLHDAQHGFRPNRSAIDNIFMLAQVVNARKQNKQDTFLFFLDIEKAYDSVWRPGLLYHLWNKGITGRMFRVLAQMTDHPSSMVMHKASFSAPFQPGMGWEQGDTLATTMFNVHIDAVLQHMWDTHPGVPITVNEEAHDDKLVALMYADDLGGFAGTPQALDALIQATRAALTKWRLKASVKPTDGSKTAIMIVKGTNTPCTTQNAYTWHWGALQIPQVTSYKYLGAWLTQAGTWADHLTKRFAKASTVAFAQHAIMSQNKLPWHLRHLVLTSVVQPVLTYACQVWNRCTNVQRSRVDAWQLDIIKRITHSPATTSTSCIQQELGVMPLHMSCDVWTLCYWHRLRNMSDDRMLQKIFSAWTGKHNPWQQNIDKLLVEYRVDTVASQSYTQHKFASYVKQLVMQRLQRLWEDASTRQQGGVCARYADHFGAGLMVVGMGGMHPTARKYVTRLSSIKRGWPAELCLKLRVESLPLKCMHSKLRKNETLVAQQRRQLCPACKQASETAAHFLLQCNAYRSLRNVMMLHLTTHFPQMVADVTADHNKWRLLLQDEVLLTRGATNIPSTHGAAAAAAACGGAAAAPGAAAVLGTAADCGATSIDAAEIMPVADYVVAAWQIRSAALAGRETYGGDAMV